MPATPSEIPARTRVAALLEELEEGRSRLASQVAHRAFLPGQGALFLEPEPPLPGVLAQALAVAGVPRLWSHQVEGLAAARRGENVLVTTPTASGKSLIFQLPVLEEAARGGSGRALFVYPLKALGQDQKGKLDALAEAAGLEAPCAIYDGDTPASQRARIRKEPPRVLVTNPDMLHLGILGHWGSWAAFLASLRWIVLDELHTYRGVFGSHFHHVLRRLLRLARDQGAEPSIIASSATAANAEEFAVALTGEPFRAVTRSGAPRQGRHFLLVQPESSPYTAALQLLIACLRAGLQTIVFTKARRITELLFSWLRRQEPELASRVASYRAGFLPEERRQIERELFSGRLQGVISTSALELGIDVGGLDACILVGFPGSVMATWQRSGRVGRDERESVTALVALPDALDQYFLARPEALLERPCERLVVDPANESVAAGHLVCAAAEKPLDRAADADYLAAHEATVQGLLASYRLQEGADGTALYTRRKRPQREIDLRGSGATYSIRRAGDGRAIGTVDGVRALHECHPGAIYLHGGRQYRVLELGVEERQAVAEPVAVDWFTVALAEKETEILEVHDELQAGPLSAWLGRLEVTERVVGYERKRIAGQEIIDRYELELPPVTFQTVGLWWAAPPAHEEALRGHGHHVLGALHAAEHAAISLFPLLALCDRGDLGGISTPFHAQVGCGAVFLYDGHHGGVGITAKGFQELPELLARVEALVASCPCEEGCPSCVHSPKCGNGNRPLDKDGAARSLRLLLAREVGGGAGGWRLRLEAGEPSAGLEAASVPGRRGRGTTPTRRPLVGAELASAREGGDEDSTPTRGPLVGEEPASAREGGEEDSTPTRGPLVGAELASAREGGDEDATPTRRPLVGAELASARGQASRPPAVAMGEPISTPQASSGTVLFDLETLRSAQEVGGWHNAHRMGIALGVVWFLEEGRHQVYREEEVGKLVEALTSARLVVGFNVKRFDYRVLSGYTGVDFSPRLPTLDLLEGIHATLGFRLGLDHLAQATLGSGKTADGLQCLEWVREGRFDLVESYCLRDVEVLRDLYLFGRREGFVCYLDRQGRKLRLPVDW
jgi:DEAD/DEAH box helicase domain-containing protein